MSLEKSAQDILPEYVEEDAKNRLQSLAESVAGAVEAGSLVVWELWMEYTGQELLVNKMSELAKRVGNHHRTWQHSAAFAGARGSAGHGEGVPPKVGRSGGVAAAIIRRPPSFLSLAGRGCPFRSISLRP